ncbi:MAG: hypothetical protein ACYC09_01555 [Bacteroidota bacterium]
MCTHMQLARAQGCSDAGFCTVPTLNPETRHEHIVPLPNSIQLLLSYGKADHGIDVRSGSLQYGRTFDTGVGIDIKATFVSLTDGTVHSSGLSDLFATVNYRLSQQITGTMGFKIPLGNGNAEANSIPLPMDLQPSLGTVDHIAGVSFLSEYGHIALAIQQPLTNNKNRFSADQYPVSSSFRNHQSTNEYRRSGDVLVRFSYPLSAAEKVIITPGILPIYHLANDSYVDSVGTRQTIEGSRGLTLNLNFSATYMPGTDYSVDAGIGFPIITRTVRPDGLTRSIVVTIDYKYRW